MKATPPPRPDDATPPAVHALLARLLPALAAQVSPAGLHDPLHDRPSPPDHYGHLGAAVALLAGGYPAAAEQALDAWLALPAERLGHLPFNRLLLLMLRRLTEDAGDTGYADRIPQGLARCPLHPPYPSNNWGLLAGATRVLEAAAGGRAHERRAFLALLQRWSTADGGFIDFPAHPAGRGATPLAYHHKALFLAALLAWLDGDPTLAAAAARLLDWTAAGWDSAALAGGLGRSSHALFGDGCLLAASLLLAPANGRGGTAAVAQALAQRLQRQFRHDGLLWLTPAGPAAADAGWDNYMYLSVYNAWTAAVCAFAVHLRRHAPPPPALAGIAWHGDTPSFSHDAGAGLLRLRDAHGSSLAFGTRGQPPQAYSLTEVELRYAGGQPFHFVAGGRALLPPPLRPSAAALLAAPALAGWVPVFRHHGRLYGLTDFDMAAAGAAPSDGQALRLELHGTARALTRSPPAGRWQKLLAALDWRFLGGRRGRGEALRRRPLPGLRATLIVELQLSPPRLRRELRLAVAPGSGIDYLNPQGHAVLTDAGWRVEAENDGGAAWQEQALPATLPGGLGRCLPACRLAPGSHRWALTLTRPVPETSARS